MYVFSFVELIGRPSYVRGKLFIRGTDRFHDNALRCIVGRHDRVGRRSSWCVTQRMGHPRDVIHSCITCLQRAPPADPLAPPPSTLLPYIPDLQLDLKKGQVLPSSSSSCSARRKEQERAGGGGKFRRILYFPSRRPASRHDAAIDVNTWDGAS